jgi:hypothetical protein
MSAFSFVHNPSGQSIPSLKDPKVTFIYVFPLIGVVHSKPLRIER